MTKSDLVKAVADKARTTIKKADAFLKTFVDIVSENLEKGNDVSIIGFGTFSVVERSARKARDFQTGKIIDIAASKTVRFKVGKTLKNVVK